MQTGIADSPKSSASRGFIIGAGITAGSVAVILSGCLLIYVYGKFVAWPRAVEADAASRKMKAEAEIMAAGITRLDLDRVLLENSREMSLSSAVDGMDNICTVIEYWNERNPRLPKSIDELTSSKNMYEKAYLRSNSAYDPWGNEFVLVCKSEEQAKLICKGPDGIEGTSDDLVRKVEYGKAIERQPE